MRQLILVFIMFALAACSGPRLPFEKENPTANTMVAPPWEAMVKAGPGADKELDLETLNGPGGQFSNGTPTPDAPAPPPPPPPVATEQSTKTEKPGVVIKAVAVPSVQGATGTGNKDLTEAMRQVLREAGWPVVNSPAPDALTIKGQVSMAAPAGPSQNVKLQWVITTPDGKRLGDIGQSNDVPVGSLSKGWGENARFATEAAADGIFKLINGYR